MLQNIGHMLPADPDQTHCTPKAQKHVCSFLVHHVMLHNSCIKVGPPLTGLQQRGIQLQCLGKEPVGQVDVCGLQQMQQTLLSILSHCGCLEASSQSCVWKVLLSFNQQHHFAIRCIMRGPAFASYRLFGLACGPWQSASAACWCPHLHLLALQS